MSIGECSLLKACSSDQVSFWSLLVLELKDCFNAWTVRRFWVSRGSKFMVSLKHNAFKNLGGF